jgi:hypothetical protein
LTPDQPISLAFAVFCSILCCILPTRSAIVPLCVAMCAYPTNVMVPPQQVQMTVARVVGLVLLLRCIFTSEVRERFRWMMVDTVGVIYFALLLSAQMMTTEMSAAINRQAGFFISALVPFWCVRMLVVDRPSFYIFLKGFLWTSVPLTVLALYQSKTGDSPYRTIMENGILWFDIKAQWLEIRPFMGIPMNRASAPFQQCIMLGWFFAIQVPWCTNLYFQNKSLKGWIIPWLILPIGTIATVSSGPMMMVALSFAFMAMFPIRSKWKAIFGTAGAAYAAVALLAKRGVMEIVSSFGLDPKSGYYRVNLMNYVMGKVSSPKSGLFDPMAGHWLAGYGNVPLPQFEEIHDLCIQWIFLTVINGLMGLFGFVIFVIACAWNLWKANKKSNTLADQWLCWSLFAILIATLLAMQLVSLFAEMYFIYHVFLGLCANSVLICGSEQNERSVGVLAEMDGRQVLLRYRLKAGQRLALVRPGGQAQV